jgi:uncharacterized protein (DUF362 family)
MEKDKIALIHGTSPLDMTRDLLEYIKPFENLEKNARIGIKPNLVCASPAEEGATTHPEIAEGIIIYAQNLGFTDITILEGSWVGDSTTHAFEVCDYNRLRDEYGIPLFNTKTDESFRKTAGNLEINICKIAEEIDFLINLPLIKGHCQTNITCALKNMKGLIPDGEKRRFHRLGLHKPIAALNTLIRQDLIIADGICPDPYFEEGGRPVTTNRMMAGYDPVLMDSYAATLLDYKVSDIPYIEIAEAMGIGQQIQSEDQIVKIRESDFYPPVIEQMGKKYLNLIEEFDACSACYANLVSALMTLQEENLTDKLVEGIAIGQGYRGLPGAVGIGNCTREFNHSLKGCPPNRENIIEFLKTVAK